jgi:hypothetical protein
MDTRVARMSYNKTSDGADGRNYVVTCFKGNLL